MSADAAQTVTFIRIDLLFEQSTLLGQCFRKHHALLVVHIVVGRAVYLWMKQRREGHYAIWQYNTAQHEIVPEQNVQNFMKFHETCFSLSSVGRCNPNEQKSGQF